MRQKTNDHQSDDRVRITNPNLWINYKWENKFAVIKLSKKLNEQNWTD